MSFKKLSVAWSISVVVLIVSLASRIALAERVQESRSAATAFALAKGIEHGAVLATFFLTCFVIAEVIHRIRARR